MQEYMIISPPNDSSIRGKSFFWNQIVVTETTDAVSPLNGITFRRNENGSYTLTGTATAGAFIRFTINGNINCFSVQAGHKYYLGGCPANGSASTYSLRSFRTGVVGNDAQDFGNGAIFVPSASGLTTCYIYIAAGTVVNNLVFSPVMIDLTAIYGSGNEPTTVSAFKSTFEYATMLYLNEVLNPDAGTIHSVGLFGTNILRWYGKLNSHSDTVYDELTVSNETITITKRVGIRTVGGVQETYALSVPEVVEDNTPYLNVPIADSFIELSEANVHTPCAKIEVYDTENELERVWTKAHLKDFSVTRCGCTGDVFTIGSVVASTLDIDVLDNALPTLMPTGLMLIPYMGYVLDGVECYVKQGVFYLDATASERSGMFTSLTAYDILGMPDIQEAVDPGLVATWDVGASPKQNAEAITSFYPKLVFENADSTHTTPVVLPENPSPREMISRLAIAQGMNALTNPATGDIMFIAPSTNITCVFSPNKYMLGSLKIAGKVGDEEGTEFTYLQAEIPDADGNAVSYTAPDSPLNGNGIGFDATYFALGADEENPNSNLELVANKVFGVITPGEFHTVHYQAFEVKTKGFPYLNPLDKFIIQDASRGAMREYDVFPTTVVHTYDGGLVSQFKAGEVKEDTNDVSSSTGTLNQLRIDTLPTVMFYKQLIVEDVNAASIIADHASVGNMEANMVTADVLASNYVQTNLANVTNAFFETFYSESGLVDNITISEGVVTGTLAALNLDANNITTGVLNVDRLNILGEDGLYYKINVNTLGEAAISDLTPAEQAQLRNQIHGGVILADSIDAGAIHVSDLAAFRATIGGFEIDSNSLKSQTVDVVKDSEGNVSSVSGEGMYLGENGTFYVGSTNANLLLSPVDDTFTMNVTSISLKEDMDIGKFRWDTRSNDNLSLKWVG